MLSLPWQYPNPHLMTWQVQADEIDHYNHVNNVVYVSKLEQVSWHHTHALGLTIDDYRALDRGMAIYRHEIDYLAPGLLDDKLLCATWVTMCDAKLRLQRQFQITRPSDGATLLKARTDYICIALSTGKPKRMPDIFASTYGKVAILKGYDE